MTLDIEVKCSTNYKEMYSSKPSAQVKHWSKSADDKTFSTFVTNGMLERGVLFRNLKSIFEFIFIFNRLC